MLAVLRSPESRPKTLVRHPGEALMLGSSALCSSLVFPHRNPKRVHVAVLLLSSHPCCGGSLRSSHSAKLLPWWWWWCKCTLYVYSVCVMLALPQSFTSADRSASQRLRALPPAVRWKGKALVSRRGIRTNSLMGYLIITGSFLMCGICRAPSVSVGLTRVCHRSALMWSILR